MIVYLRLAFGTACVLAPGWAVARAFGQRTMSAVLAWATASVFVAWAAVFAVHRSIHLAVAVLAVIFVAALLVGHRYGRRTRTGSRPAAWLVGLAGLVLGWFLWHVEGTVTGDGLFHEARVRKLVDLTSLHLRTVDEFKDGGLHPGYAFPLWHGLLALVSWFSGVDPATVVRHAPSLLAPIAAVVAWEAGIAVFGSRLRRRLAPRLDAGRVLLRPGARRLVGDDGAARDGGPSAARAGGDRALLLTPLACRRLRSSARSPSRIRPTPSSC